MLKRLFSPVLAAALALSFVQTGLRAQGPASKPPLGWNSWDSYGLSVTEGEWKSNVAWFHQHLQPAGWQYVVLDEGWYLAHPENAPNKGDQGYTLDVNGQFIPATNRFPQGLAGLAEYAHGQGLKFGIHIIRGIPKQAVAGNMPIVGSSLHAADAADATDLCRWNPDNYGVRNNAAGQAYYDGLMRLYAGWGVDFLKVDCITKPYKTDEIHMIRTAIDKTGRPMVLSVSPGPTSLDEAEDVSKNSQMWRVSDDVWDVWSDPKLTNGMFPQTIRNQFDVLASWMPTQQAGRWPDGDMLPIGVLGPRPGWGKPRDSRLTPDETRTMLTLWAIAKSPLILGSNLLRMPPALAAMLVNPEWLAVDQSGTRPQQVYAENGIIVWRSEATQSNGARGINLAIFNTGDEAKKAELGWPQVKLAAGVHRMRDIWTRKDAGQAGSINVDLPPHGSVLYRIE